MLKKLSFVLLVLIFFVFIGAASVFAQPISYSSTVSVSIGEHYFSLFGYTSPHAYVTLEGQGIYDSTRANETGFFIFANSFSPFSPRPFCLQAQDQFGRLSKVICLPSFPTDYNIRIGPVVLPPTLSLNKSTYLVGDDVVLSGQSIPNSKVTLSYFTDKKGGLFSVNAYTLPRLTIKTDDKGNYSVQLPSSGRMRYRVFTQSSLGKQNSPESVVLHLEILPWWLVILRKIFSVLTIHLLTVIFLVDLGIIYYLLRRRRRNLQIVPISFYHQEIVKYE